MAVSNWRFKSVSFFSAFLRPVMSRTTAWRTGLPSSSMALSRTSAGKTSPVSFLLCIHSKRRHPLSIAVAILLLASSMEFAPSGCSAGDKSEGCLLMNSSRVAQPKILRVALLQSKKPFSSSNITASLVES